MTGRGPGSQVPRTRVGRASTTSAAVGPPGPVSWAPKTGSERPRGYGGRSLTPPAFGMAIGGSRAARAHHITSRAGERAGHATVYPAPPLGVFPVRLRAPLGGARGTGSEVASRDPVLSLPRIAAGSSTDVV
jgi:hypothetical protein